MEKIKSLAKFKVSSLASSISSVTIFGKRLLSEEFLDAWNMSTLREEFVVLVHHRHNPTSVKQVELFHHTEHAIILTETPSNGHTVTVPKNTWLHKFPDFGYLIVFQAQPLYFFKFLNSVLHRPAIILQFLLSMLREVLGKLVAFQPFINQLSHITAVLPQTSFRKLLGASNVFGGADKAFVVVNDTF